MLALGVSLVSFLGTAGAGTHSYPPIVNPGASIDPVPDFMVGGGPCTDMGFANPSCATYIVSAINHAHAIEKIRPMSLPSNWAALSVAQQMMVLIDLERVDRGYPPYLGLNPTLTADAQRSARTLTYSEAVGFPVARIAGPDVAYYEVVEMSPANPAAADYNLMYTSAWRASTSHMPGCTNQMSAACWGGRDGALGYSAPERTDVGLGCTTCEVGIGVRVLSTRYAAYVLLIARPAKSPPRMTFTWASEKPYFTPTPTSTTASTVATTTSAS